MIITIFYYKH